MPYLWVVPYPTGVTIYDTLVSLDQNNVAVSATTFDTVLFKDGQESLLSVSVSLYDIPRALFMASFIPEEYGSYQLYAKNNVTDVVYLSNIFDVSTGITAPAASIYIGI